MFFRTRSGVASGQQRDASSLPRCWPTLALLAAILVCGCDTVTPINAAFKDANDVYFPFPTTINLGGGNFTVIKPNVVGRSHGFSLFGLIPLRRPKMTEAMDDLYSQANIHEGESKTLTHMVVEHSSAFWILFSQLEVAVRADVVQFKANSPASGRDLLSGGSSTNSSH